MKEWNEKAIEIKDLNVYYNKRRKSIFEKKGKT
jgi:peptide/nickel transport system ATP-binding protein